MKEIIASIILKEVKTHLKREEIERTVEIPPSSELGDFAFPCFMLAKALKKNPVEIAKELSKKIKSSEFEKIEAKGPYLNFFINRKSAAEDIIKEIQKQKDKFGSSDMGKGKKALVEHTSINPNASPHVGRARNGIIGDSFVRLLRFLGFKVETHYFVNDVGKQISMLVLGAEGKRNVKFDELLGLYISINKKVESNPNLEKKIFDLLNKLENGDKEVREKFRKIVEVCVDGQSKILNELGIKYDSFDYESDYLWNKKTDEILARLKKTGKLFEDDEKRLVLNQEGYNLPLKSPVLVLTRADKTSLYPLRDIAYTLDKLKINKDNNYLVLGEDQKTYFKQLAAALDLLGSPAPKVIHYSFVLLSEGKMSTRQGNVVLLEDFMKDAIEKARKELKKRYSKIDEKRAKAIAYASIKYSLLKVDPDKNVTFDLEEALSFEGNTGPYLLYTYARARSILAKAEYNAKKAYSLSGLSDKEKELILGLGKFSEVVQNAYHNLSPNLIANYAYEIAQQFNEFYHSEQVIGSEKEQFLLILVDSFSQVLKNALLLLGIETIEKM